MMRMPLWRRCIGRPSCSDGWRMKKARCLAIRRPELTAKSFGFRTTIYGWRITKAGLAIMKPGLTNTTFPPLNTNAEPKQLPKQR